MSDLILQFLVNTALIALIITAYLVVKELIENYKKFGFRVWLIFFILGISASYLEENYGLTAYLASMIVFFYFMLHIYLDRQKENYYTDAISRQSYSLPTDTKYPNDSK